MRTIELRHAPVTLDKRTGDGNFYLVISQVVAVSYGGYCPDKEGRPTVWSKIFTCGGHEFCVLGEPESLVMEMTRLTSGTVSSC